MVGVAVGAGVNVGSPGRWVALGLAVGESAGVMVAVGAAALDAHAVSASRPTTPINKIRSVRSMAFSTSLSRRVKYITLAGAGD